MADYYPFWPRSLHTPRERAAAAAASLNKVAVKWNTNKSHPAGNIIAYDQRTASGQNQEK